MLYSIAAGIATYYACLALIGVLLNCKAAESYNPEIAKETMQMVNSWAELDNALARIDALKKNGNKSFNKTNEKVEAKFDLSDINSAIGQVCLDSYKSVQEAIKDARKDKEYEQTK